MKIFQTLKDKPWHVLLIGIYPVLALYLFNIEEMPPFAITRSLIFSLANVFVASVFFLMVFTRWKRILQSKQGIILLGYTVVLIITYPLIRNLILNVAHLTVGKHRYLLPVWGLLFFGGMVIILGRKHLRDFLSSSIAFDKSMLATSFFLLLFFTFGHLFNLIYYNPSKGYKYLSARYQYLMIILLATLVLGLIFIAYIKTPKTATRWLNTISIILIGMTVIQIAVFFLRKAGKNETVLPIVHNSEGITNQTANYPDVYYIVLDAYSRADVLKNVMQLDVSDFIDELESMGFAVATCSNSNYPVTDMSITSTLNMDYLDNLNIPGFENGNAPPSSYEPFIKHSLVRRKLEELGYSTVAFKTGYPYLELTDSTYYFDYAKDASSFNKAETVAFYYLFLQTTALRPYLDYLDWQSRLYPNRQQPASEWIPVGSAFSDRNYQHYNLTLYNLAALEKTPELPGKKFVYAHLIITHEPFVFTPEGEFRYPVTGDPIGYNDQVRFANVRMLEILKTIISESKVPPIIIFQSDHGWPWVNVRSENLSAFYLPDNGARSIYPEITNVNTFRIIFNHYFGGTYPLLPDTVFVANSKSMRDFSTIPSSCP